MKNFTWSRLGGWQYVACWACCCLCHRLTKAYQ